MSTRDRGGNRGSAYVAYEGPGSLSFGEMGIPRATESTALLAVDACGVCGSDWNTYQGRNASIMAPAVLGHEIVGRVVDPGELLQREWDVAPGDVILLEEFIPCNHCENCIAGRHRKCRLARKYGNMNIGTAPGLWGGFADYVHLELASVFHRVPAGLDPAVATAAIPLSNGISWVQVAGEMRVGDSVLIAGPGQQGIACLLAAKEAGAGKVIVTGLRRDAGRLRTAAGLGAATIEADGCDVIATVMEFTEGKGVDVAIDTTPLATDALPSLVESARYGGRVVIAGLKRGGRSAVDTDVIAHRELKIQGVAARDSWAIDRALALLAGSSQDVGALRGRLFSLEEAEEAIRALGGASGTGNSDAPIHTVVIPSLGRSPADGGEGQSPELKTMQQAGV